MSDKRLEFTIYHQGVGLLVCPTLQPCPELSAVAKVLASDHTDAQCLADYLWVRIQETYAHLMGEKQVTSQLIRGLVRRFVHSNYADNSSIEAYPLVPEFLSVIGETSEDDS